MTQTSESDKNETTHQLLRRSNRIRKPNPKYANTAIVEDKSLRTRDIRRGITKLGLAESDGGRNYRPGAESNLGTSVKTRRCQTHLLQVGLQNKASNGWINLEIQGSTRSSRIFSTIWTRL